METDLGWKKDQLRFAECRTQRRKAVSAHAGKSKRTTELKLIETRRPCQTGASFCALDFLNLESLSFPSFFKFRAAICTFLLFPSQWRLRSIILYFAKTLHRLRCSFARSPQGWRWKIIRSRKQPRIIDAATPDFFAQANCNRRFTFRRRSAARAAARRGPRGARLSSLPRQGGRRRSPTENRRPSAWAGR